MNGLLRRLTRRRAATADEHPPEATAASEPVDATVVSQEEGSPLSEEERARQEEERAREEELRRQRRDLPAGLDPEELEGGVSESSRRGTLRRRIRYLRAAREVLLRDLGGFYFEVHRTAPGSSPKVAHRRLLEAKAARLDAIDQELRALEARLDVAPPAGTVVREPGIGGTCPVCAELHGSEDAYCAHCGEPLTERARSRQAKLVEDAIAARQAEAAAAQHAAEEASTDDTAQSLAAYKQATASHDVAQQPDETAKTSDETAVLRSEDNGTGEHQPSDAVAERRR